MPNLAAYIGGGLLAGTGKGIVAKAKAKREKALIQDERAFITSEREATETFTAGEGVLTRGVMVAEAQRGREQQVTLATLAKDQRIQLAQDSQQLQRDLQEGTLTAAAAAQKAENALIEAKFLASSEERQEIARIRRDLILNVAEGTNALSVYLGDLASTERQTIASAQIESAEGMIKEIMTGNDGKVYAITANGEEKELPMISPPGGFNKGETESLKATMEAFSDPIRDKFGDIIGFNYRWDEIRRVYEPGSEGANPKIFNAIGGNSPAPLPENAADLVVGRWYPLPADHPDAPGVAKWNGTAFVGE